VIEYPQWAAAFHVQIVDKENVVLLDEREFYVLTGRAFVILAPDLDGRSSVSELIARHAMHLSPPELFYALANLEKNGYIREHEAAFPPAEQVFWQGLGLSAGTATARLAHAAIHLEVIGNVSAAPVRAALDGAGIAVSKEAALNLVIVDDYQRHELAELNSLYLAQGRPWVLAKPVGAIQWLGPHFEPGRTGCWACLAQRLKSNRQVERFLQLQGGQAARLSRSAYSPHVAAASHLLAVEIARLCAGAGSTLSGAVLSLDTNNLETQRHVLVRRPQCPVCGDPSTLAPGPLSLAPDPIRFRADGGHRTVPPDVTYRRLEHHISPVTGVVTSLDNMQEGDTDGLAFSYSAGHNFAMMNNSLDWLLQNIRGRSGGKGASDIQARVSAVCEAIERYSGLYDEAAPELRASHRSLAARALHPNVLMNFSERQLRDPAAWNAGQRSAYHKAPVALDDDREIAWTAAWSFQREDVVYVPSAYCWFGHPDLGAQYFCTCDANGNAAGNTLAEAVVQGFLELVERDAVAIWWYNRISRPGIDIAAFNEPYFDRLVEHYRKDGRELWAIDISADLGIPCFAAVSRRTDRSTEDIVIGFGAHFDARLALMRALTEVNQFMPAVSKVNPAGETVYWFHDPDAVDWWRNARIEDETYLLPAAQLAPRRPGDFVQREHKDILADVQYCADTAAKIGSELIVLDQTQPDIGLPVVKVMVPGMRHFWKRFGPGRLFDVPVRLGWLERPTPESELNPTGIFF
jgi:bacteriocin biosynthesis cyclodehydratase domain-containing protein